MKPEVGKKKQVAGMMYGLAAGLAFALFAWGIDFILLTAAHGAYTWVKFVPGLFICALSGALVGWLTIRLQNTLLGILFWLALGLLFSQLIQWLPIRVAPQLIGWFNPALGDYLKYPYFPEFNQSVWFGFAVVALVGILCGLLENILIDQALFSRGNTSLIVPLVVSAMAFSLAGNTGDSLFNRHFRESIQIVDELIQFSLDNAGAEIPVDIARKMHLGALSPVKDVIVPERKLTLSNYDQYLGHIDILVDFQGKWVKCTTIYNQVTFCKLVFETPWIRYSGFMKVAIAENPMAAIHDIN